MPNIRSYDAPQNLGLQPTETGIDAVVAGARRTGVFYSQKADALNQEGQEASSSLRDVGDVAVKHEDHQQISAGAPAGVQLASNLDAAWNKFANGGKNADGSVTPPADPNDPAARQKFLQEQVEPALEQFKEGFTTENSQKWAEQFTDNLRTHLATKTAADMSTMAGIALQQNVTKTINTLSSTVRNDPSSLDFALKTLDHTIGGIAGSSPMLDPVTSAKVAAEVNIDGKKAVVQSFLTGVAEKNPDQAQRIVESGQYGEYISGPEAKQIVGYARANARLNASQGREARVMEEHTNKLQFNSAANDLEMSTIPAGPNDRPTLPPDYWDKVRAIGKMPGAASDPGRFKSLVENGERITDRLSKPEPLGPISHDTTMDFMSRLSATDNTKITSPDEFVKAYADGKLNTADFNFLNKQWADLKTPEGEALGKTKAEFFKAVEPMIDKSSLDPMDNTGKLRMYAFRMDAEKKIAAYRAAGKNPYDLLDPSNPAYLGNPAIIGQPQYQGSLQGNLPTMATRPSVNLTGPDRDITGVSVTPAPIPRREKGESLDSWMKRTGRGFAPAAAAPAPPIGN